MWLFWSPNLLPRTLTLTRKCITLARKLDAITSMPPVWNVKEFIQFLGLNGYYKNDTSHYADIAHTLTYLLRRDEWFTWKTLCQKAFTELRRWLQKPPISVHPDSSKANYTIYSQMPPNLFCSNTLLIHIQFRQLDDLKITFILGKFQTHNVIMQHFSVKHLKYAC